MKGKELYTNVITDSINTNLLAARNNTKFLRRSLVPPRIRAHLKRMKGKKKGMKGKKKE